MSTQGMMGGTSLRKQLTRQRLRYWIESGEFYHDDWGLFLDVRVLCGKHNLDEESWLSAVNVGFSRLVTCDKVRMFDYPVNQGHRYGETPLFFLTLLHTNGCISPESQITCSLHVGDRKSKQDAGEIFHIAVRPVNGVYEYASHCGVVCRTIIKYDKSNNFVDSETRKALRLGKSLEACSRLYAHIFKMSAFDFSCYIASQYLFPSLLRVEEMDVCGQVMAVLMGTHLRLGSESWLGTLDPSVVQIFVCNILPSSVLRAVVAGLLRL